jgi:hypothetical protein
VVKLLGISYNFVLEWGMMNAHDFVGGLFFFLKHDMGWVSSFLQQKVGKP